MVDIKVDWNKITTVSELVAWVRRQLGEPMIKAEITNEQIIDGINDALRLFLYWASVGYEEQFYCLPLQGGVSEYSLGPGILDLLDLTEHSVYSAGINTLFTLPNQMTMAGMFDFSMQGEHTMLLLNYHLVLDFMETLQRYSSSKYQFSYDTSEHILTLTPDPEHQLRTVTNSNGTVQEVDSPGWVLLKVKQFIGAGRPGWTLDKALKKILSEVWIRKYTLACAKVVLGRVRSKFPNFASVGNQGISLDGSDLLSEGNTEKENLEKQIAEDGLYQNAGYGISMGLI